MVPNADTRITLAEATRVWAYIGLMSFGGPAGQIALMHRELVEKRRWISDERFLHALNYCMLLPGPEATQLATYVGWLLHRAPGGIIAGALFVLPGFIAILALSLLYALFQNAAPIEALFFGLKAAVLAIVIEAVIRIGKRALKNRVSILIAAAAFIAIYLFDVPFPLIVFGAGALGLGANALSPSTFGTTPGAKQDDTEVLEEHTLVDAMGRRGELAHTRPSTRNAVRVLAISLLAWLVPIALIALALGADNVLVTEGLFFSKTAVVTFGGAYAVLAYIAQRAVETYGWLEPGEMLDGLGMAETTPGPLIMVVQFVGFMGAYRDPGPFSPILAGILGSVVTTWVTFVPCFLWIFLGAPWIEALRGSAKLHAALSAITAAVVGVILNLSVWFSLHVLFSDLRELHAGPVRLLVPQWSSVHVASLLLAFGSLVAMLRFRVGLGKTLATSAFLGMLWRLVIAG